MTESRNAVAASVGGLLEMARVERRNGLLHITSAQGGPHHEEGDIYLLAGQPVYARAGHLAGVQALRRLATLQHVSFLFAANAPRPPANIVPSLSPPVSPRAPSPTADVPGPGSERQAPRKVEPEREVLSLLLTRRQRLIYFLVDGQRTVADLARTTHKTTFDVGTILGELWEQGLVVL